MTKKQFDSLYKQTFPNWQAFTLTDRRVMYNDLMEQQSRSGLISAQQRQNWGHPAWLSKHTNKIKPGTYSL